MNQGDQAVLKSGGPIMTIDNISSNTGGVLCVWFDLEGKINDKWFNGNSVRPVEPNDYVRITCPTCLKKSTKK